MKKFQFGDFAVRIDSSDYDFMMLLKRCLEELRVNIKKIKDENEIKKNDSVCRAVYCFFDHMFGAGSAQKLFCCKISLRRCTEALNLLAKTVRRDAKASRRFGRKVLSKMQRLTRGKGML